MPVPTRGWPIPGRRWSRKYFNLWLATWNCFSLSKERFDYCRKLQYDVLTLTELHNLQNNIKNVSPKLWIPSANSAVYKDGPKKGKWIDPASGVAIMLSPRMLPHYRDSGHVGSRIAWVRFAGPVCNIFFVAVYLPHKFRSESDAQQIIAQLDALLATVNKNDCIIVAGDLNCQLHRNVEGCTDKWVMTSRNGGKDHDQEVLNLMMQYTTIYLLLNIGNK